MIELLRALMWNRMGVAFAPVEDSERLMRVRVHNTKTHNDYEVQVDLNVMTEERLEVVVRECLKRTR